MDDLITDIDLKEADHLIIKNLINGFMITNKFLDALSACFNQHGYGDGNISFIYWDDLDESDRCYYENEFEGVELSYADEECEVKKEDFYYYMVKAGLRYLELYPDKEDRLKPVIRNIKKLAEKAQN